MCGIVGVASGFTNGFSMKEADMFTQMLYMDAMRGWDSTGVFGVDRLGNVECHKEASEAADFLKAEEYKTFRNKLIQRGTFAVGHNRAATRGSINDKNAHPFWVEDKVILVQNGTYKGSHKELKDTEVDSEAIAHVLVENEDVTEALKKVNAAYALVWYDTRNKTLNLIRNDERPLFLAKMVNGGLVWCSEPGFLYLAAARNEVELSHKPEMIPPELHIQLKLNGKNWDRVDTKLDCKFVYPKQGRPFRGYQNWPYDGAESDEIGNEFAASRNVVLMPTQHRHRQLPPNHPARNAEADVDQTLSEILLERCKEYHMPKPEAVGKATAISVYFDGHKEKEYPIQLTDFQAANSHPECSTWHVWGLVANKQNLFGEKVVAHWFIYGKTEIEALDYVSREWYTAKIKAIRQHTMNDHSTVVTCFMTEAARFDLIPQEVKNEQTH